MTPLESKSVLITGASTGIGRATAERLSLAGWTVFAGVRRLSDAPKGPQIVPILLDVTSTISIKEAVAVVSHHLGSQRLGALVNNAGIALGGPLALQPLDEIRTVFNVNLFGLIEVTQAFVTLLGTDPNRIGPAGRIVNISSVAGQIGLPFLGAYAASKHALEGYSESLRRELILFGIDVVIIGPGSVATPIWDKAQGQEMGAYKGTPYAHAIGQFLEMAIHDGRTGLPADKIAQLIHRILVSTNPRTRYAPVPHSVATRILMRFLPKRFLDRAIARRLGLNQPKT